MTGIVVSVIIPTYDRPSQLENCLTSLSLQTIKVPWEVIVVDDGGDFNLIEIVDRVSNQLVIKLLSQDNHGPAKARNYGVQHSKGIYLAFLDDDCEPSEDWLENLLVHVKPKTIVGGQTKNKLIENYYSETSQYLIEFLYQEWRNKPWYFFTSNNLILTKHAFKLIGGFDENFPTSAGEDREFCARCIAYGFKLHYVPAAIIEHSHYLNVTTFWKQHFKYGKASRLIRARLKTNSIPFPKLRLSFYFDLFYFGWLKRYSLIQRIVIVMLILLSQVATLTGYALSILTYRKIKMHFKSN